MIEKGRLEKNGGDNSPIMTRIEAEGLIRQGLWDPDGMDPRVDHIFDEGIIGIVRVHDGSFRLVSENPNNPKEKRFITYVQNRNHTLFPDTPRPDELSLVDHPYSVPGKSLQDFDAREE